MHRLLILVPMIALLAACSSSDSKGCESNDDCRGELVCLDSWCIVEEGVGDTGSLSDADADAEEDEPSTEGLHRFCPDDDCAAGQECITAASPEGDLSTCEIRCDGDGDCPEGYVCDLPPVVPGALPNTCVEEDPGNGTPSEPLAGTIDGHDFEFVGGSMRQIGNSYVVGLRNYEWACGSNPGLPEVDRALVINFEVLEREVGTTTVSFGDGHGASLQSGVTSEDTVTFSVETGTLTLDEWSTVAGEEIAGELEFESGEHHVKGAFRAIVCP
ncbi:MAG: hypothetical protein ACNA8W_10250 [Bradymonadaceae bacterium]